MSFPDVPDGPPTKDNWRDGWLLWFNRIRTNTATLSDSGPTAQRPTTQLWVGRQYYDTTLGQPIWVDSLGPTVWVTADGTPA